MPPGQRLCGYAAQHRACCVVFTPVLLLCTSPPLPSSPFLLFPLPALLSSSSSSSLASLSFSISLECLMCDDSLLLTSFRGIFICLAVVSRSEWLSSVLFLRWFIVVKFSCVSLCNFNHSFSPQLLPLSLAVLMSDNCPVSRRPQQVSDAVNHLLTAIIRQVPLVTRRLQGENREK